ncbi:hypothetical protein Tco_0355499, partial [Tanacetum coccineum]
METEAIDNQANLVNYDNENENEIDDLGYQSEEYIEDAHKAQCLQILSWKKVGPEARNKLWDEITRYFDVDYDGAESWPPRNTSTTSKRYDFGVAVKYAKAKMRVPSVLFRIQDEEPTSVPCVKGRVTKDEDYQDDEIDQNETNDQEEPCRANQGTDAMTLVLVKEKGCYQEVGSGMTYQEKELLIKSMSSKMSQTEGMVTKLKYRLVAQEGQLQSTPTQLTPLDVSLVEIHLINRSADEEGGTTVLGCDQNDVSIRKEMQKRETVKSVGARERLDQSETILQVKIHNPKKMC